MGRSISGALEYYLHTKFRAWGGFVARNPGRVIVAALVLCAAAGAGFVQVTSESNPEKLWVPQDAPAISHRETYLKLFGSGLRREQIILADRSGSTVLTVGHIADLVHLDEVIRGTTVSVSGKEYSYTDVCAKACSTCDFCLMRTPLEYWYNIDTHQFDTAVDTTDAEIVARIQEGTNPFGGAINNQNLIGGVSRDAQNKITSALAMKATYFVTDDESLDEVTIAWEKAMLKRIEDASLAQSVAYAQAEVVEMESNSDATRRYLFVLAVLLCAFPCVAWILTKRAMFRCACMMGGYLPCQSSISNELSSAISGDVLFVNIGVMCIVVYAVLVLGRFLPVYSRAGLAVAGVLSVVLAIASAYGLASWFHIPLTPVTNVLPFILIGLGVDDMFVLTHAVDETDKKLSLEERMAKAMSHAGVSITITSVTDLFAFSLGATSQLYALQCFCTFAALGILFDYLLQISFFYACLVYDERRISGKRADCCPCVCSVNDVNLDDFAQNRGKCWRACCSGALAKTERGVIAWFLEHLYAPFIVKKPVKIAVLVLFVGLAGTCAYGASQLRQDFTFRLFVPGDSALLDVFDADDRYFGDIGVPASIIMPTPLDYSLENIGQRLQGLRGSLEGSAWVKTGSAALWYDDFVEWLKTMAEADPDNFDADSGLPRTRTLFYTYLHSFLASNAGSRYQGDIIFDPADSSTTEVIKASKFSVTLNPLEGAEAQVDAMKGLRALCSGSLLDGAFPYSFQFLYYEQYAIIVSEAVQNVGLALLAVAIICFLLLAHPVTALTTLLCIAIVDLDLLGLMYFWGLVIDSVTVANIVLAIGLAVDYSAHIAHAFMVAEGTRDERVQIAIRGLGTSVVHGAVSTFVAVLVLAFSNSYIFSVFFRMFFLICLLGITHGLVLLPVLLSLWGPPTTYRGNAAGAKGRGRQVDVELAAPSVGKNA